VLLIAITGWGQAEDRRRASEAGFDHHFTKPVALDELLRLIAGTRRGLEAGELAVERAHDATPAAVQHVGVDQSDGVIEQAQ
jgi:DNA-binding response OmpR family regulator